ncbi:hypothetical protein A7A78_02960 [Aequorivita soesokkakensis]|jgi:hypothetical protein|uniref:Uncharacterized protein n=1 Tax=Aequorivita soesokkakensis TaxID=1385699 RepID=A0A1A9LFD7_9FLAO|nr:hypothetical protein [Aequorivita soesokkakensis]OAD91471.1 hypothetical protein A7A78_02960 [Aequorivita soesokkakensis]
MKIITIFLFFLITTFSFSQEYKLEDAQKTTTDLLQALKILDLPEGKEMLVDLVFESSKSFPIVSSSNLLFEKLFDTDIEEIKGYKALLEIQSLSKANTPLTLRYLLISYLDKKENKWKVFSFRENIDTEREVLYSKKGLTDDNDSRKMQYRLRNLAYWQIMNGELLDAKDNYLKAFKEATAAEDKDFDISTYLTLDKIIDIRNLQNK